MEYQKIITSLDNNSPLNIEQKDALKRMWNVQHCTNSQIKFKTSMLNSSLCDYGDALQQNHNN